MCRVRSSRSTSGGVERLVVEWEFSNLYPFYPTYIVRRRWRRVKKMLHKVIKLSNEGLKLTCGLGCPVGHGVVESWIGSVDRRGGDEEHEHEGAVE